MENRSGRKVASKPVRVRVRGHADHCVSFSALIRHVVLSVRFGEVVSLFLKQPPCTRDRNAH